MGNLFKAKFTMLDLKEDLVDLNKVCQCKVNQEVLVDLNKVCLCKVDMEDLKDNKEDMVDHNKVCNVILVNLECKDNPDSGLKEDLVDHNLLMDNNQECRDNLDMEYLKEDMVGLNKACQCKVNQEDMVDLNKVCQCKADMEDLKDNKEDMVYLHTILILKIHLLVEAAVCIHFKVPIN